MSTAAEIETRKWRGFDMALNVLYATYENLIRAFLRNEARRIAEKVASAGEAAATQPISAVPWFNLLTQLHFESINQGGEQTYRTLGVNLKDAPSLDPAARGWMSRNVSARAAGLADTSRKNVSKVLADADEAQIPADARIAYLRRELERIADWRSQTISMTECHGGAYFGMHEAAIQSRMPLAKLWTVPRDRKRTCDQHAQLHGQRQGLRRAFTISESYGQAVGPFDLLYPGDVESGASAAMTINCRCSMDLVLTR